MTDGVNRFSPQPQVLKTGDYRDSALVYQDSPRFLFGLIYHGNFTWKCGDGTDRLGLHGGYFDEYRNFHLVHLANTSEWMSWKEKVKTLQANDRSVVPAETNHFRVMHQSVQPQWAHQPQKKEDNNMRSLVLVALATLEPTATDELSLTGPMADAVKEAKDREAKAAKETAVTEIQSLLKTVKQTKDNGRANLRNYRERVKAEEANLAEIDRLFAFGNQTGNFVPLLVKLGRIDEWSLARGAGGVTPEEFTQLKDAAKDFKLPVTKAEKTDKA